MSTRSVDSHGALYDRIAELEQQIAIVREAATIGAENDTIKIKRLMDALKEQQEQNNNLREEVMRMRELATRVRPSFSGADGHSTRTTMTEDMSTTSSNSGSDARDDSKEKEPVAEDGSDNDHDTKDKVSTLMAQASRDVEWLTSETERRRSNVEEVRRKSSMELARMKRRLSC